MKFKEMNFIFLLHHNFKGTWERNFDTSKSISQFKISADLRHFVQPVMLVKLPFEFIDVLKKFENFT